MARGIQQQASPSQQQLPPSLSLRPRVVSLNVLVAGLSGLGKTTTCEALLQSWIQQEEDISLKRPADKKGFLPKQIFPITKVVDPSRQFERFDKATNTILRVRIIDTPGFGNRVDHRDAVKPIASYMHRCRRQQFRAETSTQLPDKDVVLACDDLVHVCLYFLSPGRFLEMDAYFLKRIQKEVSIIPVIAKADTLTNEEITAYRAELVQAFARQGIVPYNFDVLPKRRPVPVMTTTPVVNDDYTTTDANANTNVTMPNDTANDAATLDPADNTLRIPYSRGRRPGEALGVVSRDGRYPWGSLSSMDPVHSDLILVRDLLLSQHTETFVELARLQYGLYRTRRIQRRQGLDVLKIVALGVLAAKALGVPMPFLDRFSPLWAKFLRLWAYLSSMVVQAWKSIVAQRITDTTAVLDASSTVEVVDVIADQPVSSGRWFRKK